MTRGKIIYVTREGHGVAEVGMSEKSELVKIMEDMDWDLFQQQKEWLYVRQIQIEKWYGQDAAALPAGILNMMDKIQDVWEKEVTCEDRNRCWYEERWLDEDLRIALKEADVEVTEANVEMLKKRCAHIFDDKSVRNEMLVSVARVMKGNE